MPKRRPEPGPPPTCCKEPTCPPAREGRRRRARCRAGRHDVPGTRWRTEGATTAPPADGCRASDRPGSGTHCGRRRASRCHSFKAPVIPTRPARGTGRSRPYSGLPRVARFLPRGQRSGERSSLKKARSPAVPARSVGSAGEGHSGRYGGRAQMGEAQRQSKSCTEGWGSGLLSPRSARAVVRLMSFAPIPARGSRSRSSGSPIPSLACTASPLDAPPLLFSSRQPRRSRQLASRCRMLIGGECTRPCKRWSSRREGRAGRSGEED